jgi:hypothetical protein
MPHMRSSSGGPGQPGSLRLRVGVGGAATQGPLGEAHEATEGYMRQVRLPRRNCTDSIRTTRGIRIISKT